MRPLRALTAMLIGAAVLLASLLTGAPPAAADPTTSLGTVVLDQASILDDARVRADIAALTGMDGSFRVGVLTSDDPSLRADSYDADMHAYVLTQRGESLLRADGTGLDDDLLLVTISPTVRKLGVYAGDGVPLSSSDVESIVEAMRAPARSTAWDEAVVDGVRTYADIHHASPPAPGGHVTAAVVGWVFAGVVGFVVLLVTAVSVRNSRRRAREERARRVRVAADIAERLAWDGPGAQAVDAAVESWRAVVHDCRTAERYSAAGVSPGAVLDVLTTAQGNGGVPTREQRLDPYVVRVIESATGERLLYAVRSELDYVLRRGDWEQRWSTRLDSATTRLAGARSSISGWLSEAAEGETVAGWTGKLDGYDRSVREIDAEVQARRLDPDVGESRLDGLVNEVRVYLTGQSRAFVRELDRSRRALIARNPRRNEGDLSLSSLVLSGVLAAQAADARSASASSSSSYSPTTTFISTGGFTGGSGSF